MSLFGLLSGINLMVWHFGVGIIGMGVVQVSSSLKWWAYDSAWAIANDTTKSTGVRKNAGEAADLIKSSWIEHMSITTMNGLTLWTEGIDWYAAQLLAMPREEADKVQNMMIVASELFTL